MMLYSSNLYCTARAAGRTLFRNKNRFLTQAAPKYGSDEVSCADKYSKIPVSIKAYYISRSLNLDKIIQKVYGGGSNGHDTNAISGNKHISYQNKSVTITVSHSWMVILYVYIYIYLLFLYL